MQRTYTKVPHEIHPNVTKDFERFSLFFVCLFCFVFCFVLFFQITFDLLLTNTSCLDTLEYTDQPI